MCRIVVPLDRLALSLHITPPNVPNLGHGFVDLPNGKVENKSGSQLLLHDLSTH